MKQNTDHKAELIEMFGPDYHLNGLTDQHIKEQYREHQKLYRDAMTRLRNYVHTLLEKHYDLHSERYQELLNIALMLETVDRGAEGAMYYVKGYRN